MTKAKEIETHDGCPICGDALLVTTKMPQDEFPDSPWCAYEQDPVRCAGCGAKGQVVIDGDEAHVSVDEETPHNLKCREDWDTVHRSQEVGPPNDIPRRQGRYSGGEGTGG